MPDLASALRKALDDWEPPTTNPAPTPEPKPSKVHFAVTNNVTRVTFDYVRSNPGKTRVEVARELANQGFNSKSVSSLLGQMIKQEMLRENGGLLYAKSAAYTPLKSAKSWQAAAEKPRKKVIIVRKPAPAPEPAPEPVVQAKKEWSPNDVIDTLTVHQAIALFKELRNILVG
jgi:predicted SPOUT superfamily RNA methylase MTH1